VSYKCEEIEGIGPKFAAKLKEHGIVTTDHLLDHAGSAKGRKELAAKLKDDGVSEKHILRWANCADLMRIKGVGEEFSDLLEAAGVDTVKELKMRKPENLHAKMVEVNEQKNLTRRLPSADQVADWVEQAKVMEPKMTY